jgi:hypothetical protein
VSRGFDMEGNLVDAESQATFIEAQGGRENGTLIWPILFGRSKGRSRLNSLRTSRIERPELIRAAIVSLPHPSFAICCAGTRVIASSYGSWMATNRPGGSSSSKNESWRRLPTKSLSASVV